MDGLLSYMIIAQTLIIVLSLVLLELIQMKLVNRKILKWLLPFLSFIVLFPFSLKMIFDSSSSYLWENGIFSFLYNLFIDVVLGFLLLNFPTFLFIATNFLYKVEKQNEKLNYYIKKIFLILIFLVVIYAGIIILL